MIWGDSEAVFGSVSVPLRCVGERRILERKRLYRWGGGGVGGSTGKEFDVVFTISGFAAVTRYLRQKREGGWERGGGWFEGVVLML